jgi:hypothetical protein
MSEEHIYVSYSALVKGQHSYFLRGAIEPIAIINVLTTTKKLSK